MKPETETETETEMYTIDELAAALAADTIGEVSDHLLRLRRLREHVPGALLITVLSAALREIAASPGGPPPGE